jgi:transcriptional regulator with XRE-family HTH domain
LTAAQVARVTGTSESNVAAYERGDKVPGPLTLQRMVDAIDAGSESAIFVNGLITTPQASAAIRSGLRRGWTTRELLRIVRELRSNSKWVVRPIDQRLFFARPSTTGDRRWDALLAGATEELATLGSIPIPEWAEDVRLEDQWFVTEDPAFNEYLLANSPEPFRSRNVMIDPDALESV